MTKRGEPLYVESAPYPWPYNGDLRPDNTALIVIDMQVDFCAPGGYVDKMGYDLALTRGPIGPIQNVLKCLRDLHYFVMHTREGHLPDLSDCPPNKRWRSARIGAEIGSAGPCGRILVKGEPGWQIIPELAPLPTEVVIDKPGKGSFVGTNLDLILRSRGITNLVRASAWRVWGEERRACLLMQSAFPLRHPLSRSGGAPPDLRRRDDGRVRAHHHEGRQRHGIRVPTAGGLLRRHRPCQPRRRHQHGPEAGRGVRRGVVVHKAHCRSGEEVGGGPDDSSGRRDASRCR
jgi:nicotinamidase-related amidase